PLASPQVLQPLLFTALTTATSRLGAGNVFVRGPVVQLPSGPVNVVVGAEYTRASVSYDDVLTSFNPPNSRTGFSANSRAVFCDARVPILANKSPPSTGDTLAATFAIRHDKYDVIRRGATTPQYGLEWRPQDSLLLRGTYGKSFKSPALVQLLGPT